MNRVLANYYLLVPSALRPYVSNIPQKISTYYCCQCKRSSHVSLWDTIIPTRNISLSSGSKRLMTTELQKTYSLTFSRAASTGWVTKIRRKLGLPEKMKFHKFRLVESACRMYMCCAEVPDYMQMIKVLKMSDTYYSWYLLAELHTWLMLVRLSLCNREGEFVRVNLIKAYWADIKKRTKEVGSSQNRREELILLSYHFNAALFSYDEGLLTNDRILASALWRNLFEGEDTEPELIELMVQYVRKQVKHLDEQADDDILRTGLVSFLPLYTDEAEETRTKLIWNQIYKSQVDIPK